MLSGSRGTSTRPQVRLGSQPRFAVSPLTPALAIPSLEAPCPQSPDLTGITHRTDAPNDGFLVLWSWRRLGPRRSGTQCTGPLRGPDERAHGRGGGQTALLQVPGPSTAYSPSPKTTHERGVRLRRMEASAATLQAAALLFVINGDQVPGAARVGAGGGTLPASAWIDAPPGPTYSCPQVVIRPTCIEHLWSSLTLGWHLIHEGSARCIPTSREVLPCFLRPLCD